MKNKLPNGWKHYTLGDESVCELIMGQSPDSNSYNTKKNGLPFYQGKKEFGKVSPTPIYYCSKPKKIVETGDILLCVRAPVGPTNIATEKSCIGRGLAGIRANQSKIVIEFLLYFFKRFETEIGAKGKGSTFNAITKRDLENTFIPIPPLKEQQKIVKVLDATLGKIDQTIELVNINIEKLEQLNSSVLDEVFSSLETKSKVDSVKNISEKIQYGYTGKTLSKSDYYYLRITDIQKGKVNWEKTPYSDIESSLVSKYVLNKGDIVFARTGATSGKSYLFKDIEKSVFASYLIRVVLNQKITLPEYLYFFFQSPKYWKQVESKTIGAAQPNVNGKKLGEIVLPIPTIDKQKQIIKYLDHTTEKNNQLIQHYKNKLQSLQDLKKSVLDSAFKGKLKREVVGVEKSSVLDCLFPELDTVSEVANLQQAIIVLKTKQVFGSGRGKVYLQKTSANLKTIKKADIPYEFKRSNYGEFSWKLSEDLDSNPYLRKVSTAYGEVYEVKKDSKKEISEAIKTNKYAGFTKSVNELLTVYQDDLIEGVTDRVELLNTVIRAISDTKSTIGNTIYNFMGNWEISQKGFKTKADKYNTHETFAMISLVRRLGWDNELLK